MTSAGEDAGAAQRALVVKAGGPSWRVWAALAAILLLALLVRAWALERPGRIISRDGVRYAKIARAIGEGRVGEALANDYPPGAPAVMALGGALAGARSDRDFAGAACGASVLLGALSVVPALLLARRAAGDAAGLLGALALALHPHHVDITADALSEPLMLLCALGSLAAGVAAAERAEAGAPRVTPLAALSGFLGGVAALARPEGVLAPLGALVLPGALPRRAAATLAALALVLGPYAARASLDEGRPAITKKKDAAALVAEGAGRPAEVASNALRNVGRAFESGQAVTALAALGLALSLARSGSGRRAALATGVSAALLLGAESLVRADPRFGLALSTLAAPFAGAALDAGARRLGRPRAPLGAAALLCLATAPGIVRATAPDHPHYLDCARAIEAIAASRGLASPAILAPDARIAHLAGDEGASDARGRSRLEPGQEARADVLVRWGDDPPPPGLALRPIGRFPPPEGSRARPLAADLVVQER